MRPVSNACPGESGEVPDAEVNAHLGNPGLKIEQTDEGEPMPAPSPYLILLAAVVAEVIATSALKASAGLTKLGPTLVVFWGYAIAFWFLSLTLSRIPTGVAYAIWSGLGVVLISIVGYVLFKQRLDLSAMIGLALILAGVAVINLFSKSVAH
jgi:small multidrug resistance pump